METFLIIALIICGAIVVGFATKFISQAFKIATRILLIVILILSILTYLVYTDIRQLQQDITTSQTTFLLEENGKLYAGVGINPNENLEIDFDTIKHYTNEELTEAEKRIANNQMPDNNTRRTFLVTPSLLNQTYELDFGISLNENDMLQILKSEKPYEVLAAKISPELQYSAQNLERIYGSEGVIKSYLLAALVVNYFKEPKIGIHTAIKEREFTTIPDTISFKVLRYIPFIGTDVKI